MYDQASFTTGLTTEEVTQSRLVHGSNTFNYKKESRFIHALGGIAREPMILMLLAATALYFISGKWGDGLFMAFAILLVSGISFFQDSRSRIALDKLKDFSQPACTVIRNSQQIPVPSEELVVGDCLIAEEGATISADGQILQSNDFSVNESLLTGESLPVYKDNTSADHEVYSGTLVMSGLAHIRITAVGRNTKLGNIGTIIEQVKDEKTPLELQIDNFVRYMILAGALVFLIVWGINYMRSSLVLDSLLKALTLAMSILPEEIPVAFTTFMALGAWRLMKLGIVVKNMKTVETLGSATIICTDKTGTITENKMTLARLFVPGSGNITNPSFLLNPAERSLIRSSMWASEPIPFDPMEKTLHEAYTKLNETDERFSYKIIHEYPLGGTPPMMTHVFENKNGDRIIAAKGAPETIFRVSGLHGKQATEAQEAVQKMAADGYRVLGVAEAASHQGPFPADQEHFRFTFKGLIAFYDPPKKNIADVLYNFYEAGISVKIVTGDNADTTSAIARQIGFKGYEQQMSGDELMNLSPSQLQDRAGRAAIFTRMFPEAKLKVIQALKANQEIVAMTGDGVNDGPSLKAAHIGIAMGKKGSALARQAASLILLEDDLSKMVDAIAMGRKIYSNLKKAIRYIISIHIPIILTVFLPLALGWVYPSIFSPIHVIFLELIMGPTCSIIYENEPLEKNAMKEKPRIFSHSFFSAAELGTSIIQGLALTAGCLLIYQFCVGNSYPETLTRTLVFSTLITGNIILTLVNRSFHYSILTTLHYKNKLVPLIIGITVGLSTILIYLTPVSVFFGLEAMNPMQFLLSTGTGFISVIWYELVKWQRRLAVRSQLFIGY
ncbi:MAG: cation-translocating P-type ATPase [Bacteroidia bacterium]